MANKTYDHQLKARMQAALQHQPVHLTGEQAVSVVHGFSETPYRLHTCAVMPEHVHLVVAHTPNAASDKWWDT